MDVCVWVYSVFVLYCVQVAVLRRADPLIQGVLPTVYKLGNCKRCQGPKGFRAIDIIRKCVTFVLVR
jgi:hypothetical protein